LVPGVLAIVSPQRPPTSRLFFSLFLLLKRLPKIHEFLCLHQRVGDGSEELFAGF
jgi:hypothetical protein